MADLSTSEILRRAATHMETVGHHRGHFAPMDLTCPVDALPCCAEGAIAFVCTGDPLVADATAHFVVDELEGWLHDQEPPVLAAVHTWSDREPTPIVIASLRAAAADLEAS